MITVVIHYISLIEPVHGTHLSRVTFPSGGHELHIYRNGHYEEALSGDEMALEITDSDDKPVEGLAPAPLPIGEPVLSLGKATDNEGRLKGKPTDDLLDNPLFGGPDARTVLHLPGGEFTAQLPTSPTAYADSVWEFATKARTYSQKLTDTVSWTLELKPSWTCSLRIDKRIRAILAHTETLTFTNLDHRQKPFPVKNERAVMNEVRWLYRCLDPQPAQQPDATTGIRTTHGGELPLCPVGEP